MDTGATIPLLPLELAIVARTLSRVLFVASSVFGRMYTCVPDDPPSPIFTDPEVLSVLSTLKTTLVELLPVGRRMLKNAVLVALLAAPNALAETTVVEPAPPSIWNPLVSKITALVLGSVMSM
jgi:hypothetical protein